jgi:2-oxo-4-hydroxy-4-carboxy-5-ureidoimidazoline decarboxylase
MTDPGLTWLDGLSGAEAERELRSCCASPAWCAAIAAGRPYPDRGALLARSDEVIATLDWAEILLALEAHPRIGQRAAGADREASWSQREQSGMDSAPADVRAALVEANRAYEDRFGHVFLIFASGRTDTQMLAAARERVGNDPVEERAVVRGELARIAALRLERLMP